MLLHKHVNIFKEIPEPNSTPLLQFIMKITARILFFNGLHVIIVICHYFWVEEIVAEPEPAQLTGSELDADFGKKTLPDHPKQGYTCKTTVGFIGHCTTANIYSGMNKLQFENGM